MSWLIAGRTAAAALKGPGSQIRIQPQNSNLYNQPRTFCCILSCTFVIHHYLLRTWRAQLPISFYKMSPMALGQTIAVVEKSGKVISTVSIFSASKLFHVILFGVDESITEQNATCSLQRSQGRLPRAEGRDCRSATCRARSQKGAARPGAAHHRGAIRRQPNQVKVEKSSYKMTTDRGQQQAREGTRGYGH